MWDMPSSVSGKSQEHFLSFSMPDALSAYSLTSYIWAGFQQIQLFAIIIRKFASSQPLQISTYDYRRSMVELVLSGKYRTEEN